MLWGKTTGAVVSHLSNEGKEIMTEARTTTLAAEAAGTRGHAPPTWGISHEVTLAAQVEYMRKELGLRVGEIAHACGVTRQTVRNWRKSTEEPRDLRYEDFRVVIDRLVSTEALESRLIGAWLRSNDRGLGGVRPLDAIRAGRLTEVIAAADAFSGGSSLPASVPRGYEPVCAAITEDDLDELAAELRSDR